jgi:hypothetical protein
MSERVLIGTRKGTFIAEKSGGGWKTRLAGHEGVGVNFVARDPNSGTLWALLGHGHWGPKLSRSKDDGATWEDATTVALPEGAKHLVPPIPGSTPEGEEPAAARVEDATVQKLWVMAFGQPGRLYIGTIPGALFVSDDDGESFELNRGLWDHESRGGNLFDGKGTGFTHWFGTPASEGGNFAPGIHSILVDPRDHDHLYIAISTAGVLESKDAGKTWRTRNKGMLMDYLPDPAAEWGHDPHAIELCARDPDHIWQQNHCGVFYSSNGGEQWAKVSRPDEGVHFGFPVAADERDGRTAWLVPGKADSQRTTVDGSLFVARTEDGGQTWKALREGLPQDGAYDVVYRHAFSNKGDCLAFGSTTGNLYLSEDRGDTWQTVSNNLPPVYSVRWA